MKYRVYCVGQFIWELKDGFSHIKEIRERCGWKGVRTDSILCECYDINRLYCRPLTPGPGCPRGIDWPCPKCKGSVAGKPIKHRSSS